MNSFSTSIALWLTLTVSPAFGATYYIATDGSDAAAGTEGAPWQTWNKVRNTIADGDTVIARGGAWAEYVWVNAKSNIMFRAYPGETPRLARLIYDPPTDATPALWITGSTNITVDGFVITNNSKNIAITGSDTVNLLNCVVGYSTNADEHSASFIVNSSRFMTVSNTVIRDVGYINEADANDEGESFKLGAQTDTTATWSYGHRFVDCTFIHGGHVLAEVASRLTIFRGCVFYNDDFFPHTNGVSYGNRWLSFLGGNAVSNLVENCRFGYNGKPSDSPQTVPGLDISASRNIMRFNSLYDVRGVAFAFYQKGFGETPSSSYVYQNTILYSGWDTNLYYFWRPAFGFFHEDTTTNNVIVNNLVANNAWTNIWHFNGGNNHSNAQLRLAVNLSTDTPGVVSTNMPGETSVTAPNLRLRSDSIARDAGAWLTTITSASGSGTTFTVADAGYFYDGWGIPGEAGDLIQLQGQTITTRITAVNYETQTLTVQDSLSWTNGQSLALSYYGPAPDVGAFEWNPSRMTVTGNVTVGGNLNVQGVAQ